MTVLMVNVLLLIVSAVFFGKEFVEKTIFSTLAYPVLLEIVANIPGISTITNDLMLCALFGGLLVGCSMGLVVKAGGSTGGTDVVAMLLNKYTGSRGKSGSNDANAEYIGWLRNVMDQADVSYQFAELGKVDAGGGGTIAYIMAKYGMQVIDSGVAVLSMHSPYEVTSKVDVYEAYKAYRAFLSWEDEK